MALLPDAVLIAVRESLEAFLIVGILFGLVTKFGRPEVRRTIVVGFALALAASLAVAWIFEAAISPAVEEEAEEYFELVAGLVAVGVLTYMIVWMWRHTRTLAASFKDKVGVSLAKNEVWAIGALAFVAVVREGFEVVLFYEAGLPNASGAELALSTLVGFAAAGAIAYAIFAGVLRVDLAKFFLVTGVLLLFVGAGVIAHSVHEAEELGLIAETDHVWDTSAFVPDRGRLDGEILAAMFGYEATPTVAYLVAYFAFLLGVGAWYLGGVSALRKRLRAAPATEPEPVGAA